MEKTNVRKEFAETSFERSCTGGELGGRGGGEGGATAPLAPHPDPPLSSSTFSSSDYIFVFLLIFFAKGHTNKLKL